MRSDKHEWDDAKATQNHAKHGVSFRSALWVFRDPLAIELLDERADYGEDRFIRIGMAGGVVLLVVYTERGDRLRIISARRATKYEQNEYHRQIS